MFCQLIEPYRQDGYGGLKVPLPKELRDKVANYYEKEGKGRIAKKIREKGLF